MKQVLLLFGHTEVSKQVRILFFKPKLKIKHFLLYCVPALRPLVPQDERLVFSILPDGVTQYGDDGGAGNGDDRGGGAGLDVVLRKPP